MAEPDATLRRIERLGQRLAAADAKADALRAELRQEMATARGAGVTISAIARALGVSRQRVQQIFGRVDRD
jgi:DNA invertase Pin-like site-specific DNA recombinase